MEHIKPKKSLGQNFLIDKNIAKKIVDSLEISPDDFVVEIGPGTGSLTEFLVKKCFKLILIEIDVRAVEILNKKFGHLKNVTILQNDFSKLNLNDTVVNHFFKNSEELNLSNLNSQQKKKIKLIGNIPYYLTSDILFKIFENADIIDVCVLTVQKEVALRIVSPPGNKIYGILSIAAKLSGEPKLLFDVPPMCFHPPPKVISSVIKLNLQRKFTKFEFDEIMILVKKAFNQRRKILRNSLKEYFSLIKTNENFSEKNKDFIENYLNKRPEELSYLDFKELYEYFKSIKRENQ
ncbi:MAG: 16S rRNA (adenine(1518)-N(6)/adenine(1519)-N(6))-dimethyltransferase RsmA [Candidatus Kapabacteria bacterium]|nr:16S rRNA (adenine(1518)-N(6)/adenine(1519)-N(6))-dimethyltransferase RsmA [Candidatus Kapabacteria bacterium]